MRLGKRHRRAAVIAPLREELLAFLDVTDSTEVLTHKHQFTQFRTELSLGQDPNIELLFFSQPALGRAHAAALATFIFVTCEVDFIVVAGLCGGLTQHVHRDDTLSLGDVIFATSLIEVEIRKFANGQFELRQEPWRSDIALERVAYDLQSRIRAGTLTWAETGTGELIGSTSLAMHCGPIVSLGSVVADRGIGIELSDLVAKSGMPRPLAVEMEGNGILTAASIFGASTTVAMIRAVSDFADEHKNDMARPIACRNAAYVTLEFIRSYYATRRGRPV